MSTARNVWDGSSFSLSRSFVWVVLHSALLVGLLYAPGVWSPGLWFVVLGVSISIYVTMCVGVAVGMHRGLIHRSFRAPKWVERVLVYIGVLAGIGGPITMARTHEYRDIHQKGVDCPPFFGYGYGMWRSYVMQMFRKYDGPELPEVAVSSISSDRWYQWMERTFWLHQVLLCIGLWLGFGWPGVVWFGLCRLVLNINGFWLVGYVSHCYGKVDYVLPGQSEMGRNNSLFGWLSFGEGWHNTHHAFPSSARTGFTWWEVDVSYITIVVLSWFGFIEDIVVPSETQREMAKNPDGFTS